MPTNNKLTSEEIAQKLIELSDINFRSHIYFAPDTRIFYRYNADFGIYKPLHFEEVKLLFFNELVALKANPLAEVHQSLSINTAFVEQTIDIVAWKLISLRTMKFELSPLIAFPKNQLLLHPISRQTIPFDPNIFVTLKAPDALNINDFTPLTLTGATSPKFLASRFKRFLDETVPDPQVQSFLQLMAGYLILPSIDAHAAFFLYGTGANGKSVFLDLLRSLFPPHLLSSSRLQDLTTNHFRLASLAGKHLNISGEEESKYLASDVFKNIVAGDPIDAERKYEGAFTFRPHIKLIFATNSIPLFDAVDTAIARRLHIIPFSQTIPPESRDYKLTSYIINNEMDIFYHWVLDGAFAIHSNEYRFPKPQALSKMFEDYEEQVSSTIAYLNERVTVEESAVIQRSIVYDDYRNWCVNTNRKAVSLPRFMKELTQKLKAQGVTAPKDPVYNPDAKVAQRVFTNIKLSQIG